MTTSEPTTTRWNVYATGEVAFVTDEDMGEVRDSETALFRCVADGTEDACDAAARLWAT